MTPCRVSPFGHPRITARLAAPRGLSQPPTSFIGSWCQGIHRVPLITWPQRCSRPLCSSQTTTGPDPPPTRRITAPPGDSETQCGRHAREHGHDARPRAARRFLRTQQRADDRGTRPPTPFHHLRSRPYWSRCRSYAERRTGQCSTHEHHRRTIARSGRAWPLDALTASRRQLLLRKEVIQPHLPVRLPCYDFVPIASPTFDGSPPQGVGPRASGVTDFRDVTGGVYKARERIHRSVADLRLLATPTSWGRVADPNPN